MKGVAATVALGVLTTVVYQLFFSDAVEKAKQSKKAGAGLGIDYNNLGPGDTGAGQRYTEIMDMINNEGY